MLFRALLDILFPPLCHACKSFISDASSLHLCDACAEKISPVRSPLCIVCGIPFRTEGGIDHTCGECTTGKRPFVSARAAVHFDGAARELVHRLKYGYKVHLSRPLGVITAAHLSLYVTQSGAELIVPVPLHTKRLRQRGFNQALLIADFLGKKWQIPVSRNNLRRIRWTEPQSDLAREDRARNVRGAFAVKNPDLFQGKKILLLDDVYTTGSTVTECARVMSRAGAGEVYVATVARAVRDW